MPRATTALFDALARWLEYPVGPLGTDETLLPELEPLEVRPAVTAFLGVMESLGQDEREELYTRTFDINPVCSLEVGWHVYGETYDRGGMLVKVRGLMRECGVAENRELPDHLPQILRLFARLDDGRARKLALAFIQPALEKMIAAFQEGANPYRQILTATSLLVAERRQALEEALQDA